MVKQTNGDLLREIETIAAEAEKKFGESVSYMETENPQLSEAVFRSVSRGVAVCGMLYDEDGRPKDFILKSVNPAFEALFGVTPGSAVGRCGSEVFSDGQEAPSLEIFHHVSSEGDTAAFMLFLGKFRRTFDILAFSAKKDCFCVVFTDVTDRVAAEKERRENIRFMEDVLGSVDIWVVLLDEQGRVVFWNAAAERLSGISAEEALSKQFLFWETVCPDPQYRAHVRKQLDERRSGKPGDFVMDFAVQGAGCDCRLLEWRIKPWRFEDIGTMGLLLMGRDVTEIRRIEGELRESERRYAAAFLQTRAPMLLIDPASGRVLDCNEAALELYGYSREEMLHLTNRDFNTASPEEIRKAMDQALSLRKNNFIFHHRLKNGELRVVEVYCSPMPHQGKTLLFSIAHDITEKKNLEEQLQMMTFDCALQAKILGSILESSSDCLYVFDREGRFRFVGTRGASLFKKEPAGMAGLSWSQLGIPEDRVASFGRDLEDVFSTGKSKRGVFVLPAPQGDQPLEYALTPTFNDDGSVEMVVCSIRLLP
jgi:PAS domain S-box-containing protein